MFKSYQFIILFLAGLVLLSCKKEMDTFTPDPITGSLDIGQVVKARVSGTVYNLQAEPLAGAKVTIGQDVVYTDDNGVFLLDQANVPNRLGHITIEKQGYFKVPKSFTLGANQDIQIHTVLMDRNQSGSFSAISGGEITQDGLSLEFPSGAIVTANGQPYEGNVKVYAAVIDPDHEYFSMMMPGMLFGERLDGSGVSLVTYGMISVELESASGQSLQVAEGSTVKTSMPIPASQLSHAPSEIPMWSMENNAPYWHEETIARKEGSVYVAELPHFSFWNVDVPFPTATLRLQLVDEEGRVLSFQQIQFFVAGSGNSGFGYSGTSGHVNALVPANEVLEIYFRNACNELVNITNAGPFAPDSDNDIGEITVVMADSPILTVSGSVLGCEEIVVPSSYALIKYDSGGTTPTIPFVISFVDGAGQFEGTLFLCDESGTIEVTGIDPVNILNSSTITSSYDIKEASTLHAGTLLLCDEPDQFIDITVDIYRVVFVDSIIESTDPVTTYWAVRGFQQFPEVTHWGPHLCYLSFALLEDIPIEDWMINEPYEGAFLSAFRKVLNVSGSAFSSWDSFGEIIFTTIDLDNKILRGTYSGFTLAPEGLPLNIKFKLNIPD